MNEVIERLESLILNMRQLPVSGGLWWERVEEILETAKALETQNSEVKTEPAVSVSECRDAVRETELEAEVLRLAKSREFTEQWYAVRWERLRVFLKGTELEDKACAIMANGTATPEEPPTYAYQMNVLRWKLNCALDTVRDLEGTAADQSAPPGDLTNPSQPTPGEAKEVPVTDTPKVGRWMIGRPGCWMCECPKCWIGSPCCSDCRCRRPKPDLGDGDSQQQSKPEVSRSEQVVPESGEPQSKVGEWMTWACDCPDTFRHDATSDGPCARCGCGRPPLPGDSISDEELQQEDPYVNWHWCHPCPHMEMSDRVLGWWFQWCPQCRQERPALPARLSRLEAAHSEAIKDADLSEDAAAVQWPHSCQAVKKDILVDNGTCCPYCGLPEYPSPEPLTVSLPDPAWRYLGEDEILKEGDEFENNRTQVTAPVQPGLLGLRVEETFCNGFTGRYRRRIEPSLPFKKEPGYLYITNEKERLEHAPKLGTDEVWECGAWSRVNMGTPEFLTGNLYRRKLPLQESKPQVERPFRTTVLNRNGHHIVELPLSWQPGTVVEVKLEAIESKQARSNATEGSEADAGGAR